jgi:hypothetical protein
MKKGSTLLLITLTATVFMILHCKKNVVKKEITFKTHPDDPFKESLVESQFFTLDPKKDNVIQGKNGTIIVVPKECFVTSAGETVRENIKIELAEALELGDMLLSNLTTTSDGQPLETDGMMYRRQTAMQLCLRVFTNKTGGYPDGIGANQNKSNGSV